MEINGRMGYILRKMLESAEKIYVTDIVTGLKGTKRSFYYDIEKLNAWLKYTGLGVIRASGGCCILDTPDRRRLSELLETQTSYFFSADERMMLELVYIALDVDTVSIEKLRQHFDVSKNTVLADIKRQKETLRAHGLDIKFTPQRGYYIDGGEFLIRNFISAQVDAIKSNRTRRQVKEILQKSLAAVTGRDVNFHAQVVAAIRRYAQNIRTHFVESFVEHAACMVMAAAIRCRQGAHFHIASQEKATIKKTSEYLNVLEMAQTMAAEGVMVCGEENYYITILFLGMKNFDFDVKVSADGFVNDVANRFIVNFERNANLKIREKEQLKTRLILHLKPMYYRLKYGIRVENPLLGDIKAMYGDVFSLTEKSMKEIGGEIERIITEEEIAYLVMYIESHFNELQCEKTGDYRKNSILIVCGAGVSTSVFIRTQLMELMGNQFAFELCSVSQFERKKIETYLMIISTVRFPALPNTTVYVGAILSDRDKEMILGQLNPYKIAVESPFSLHDLMAIIKKHVADKDVLERVNFDLYSFFYKK